MLPVRSQCPLPVSQTEIPGLPYSDPHAAWADGTYASAAKDNGCIPVYWDNGWNGDKGFGVINRSTREITQPDLIAAMMRAINSDGDYEIAAPKGFEK